MRARCLCHRVCPFNFLNRHYIPPNLRETTPPPPTPPLLFGVPLFSSYGTRYICMAGGTIFVLSHRYRTIAPPFSPPPTRQLHSVTHCCLWSGHTRQQSNSLVAVIHKQESRHKVPKSVLRAVLGRMLFILHATRRTLHGASRLVQAMSAWLVETRRAQSRRSRDTRVYGHTTTTMHKLSTPPPQPTLFPFI